jgi:hypothetical protein
LAQGARGLRGYAAHSLNQPGMPESLWYFSHVETAYAFVSRFGCDVLVIEGS